MTTQANVRRQEVVQALGDVCDPEIDQPVWDLGFISELAVTGTHVGVVLRLPTYWCAPNFSYIMMEDIHEAISNLSWVEDINITLTDHESGAALTEGIARGTSFSGVFPTQSSGDLKALREKFQEKAFYARQKAVLDLLLPTGGTLDTWVPGSWRIAIQVLEHTPSGRQTLQRYEKICRHFSLPVGEDDPLVITVQGERVLPADFAQHRRKIRLITVNMESNQHICQGLLQVRYSHNVP